MPKLGVSGVKDTGKDPETGCQILSTNTIGFFGGRQTLLKVPKDGGIYNFVRVTGQWQANDCRAVAQVLDKISLNSAIIPTFLDIHTTSNPDIQLSAYDVSKIWSSENGKTTDLIMAR